MFTPITGDLLDRLRRGTNRPNATMDAACLSFYADGYLVRITDEDEEHHFVVAGNNDADLSWFLLDGSSDPIHAANQVAGLNLNEETVLDYLGFFCDFLDMEDGRMKITGTGMVKFDDYKIVPVLAPAFNGMRDGRFLCSANAVHDGVVFATKFAVSLEGRTEMLTGDPIEPVTLH